MSGRDKRGRNAIALGLSAIYHLILLGVLINQAPPDYDLPEPVVPPMDVRIEPMPQITPPVVEPPKPEPILKPLTPPPPQPAPPKPAPPKPAPPAPQPPTPEPPKPTPPKPAPPKPSPLPAPVAPPTPPAPTPAPATAPVVPNPGSPKPSPPMVVTRPSPLNLHKPNKDAPANVPTLPMAPAAGAAGAPGAAATSAAGAAAGAQGDSRLNGLSPFPYGAMPSGGPGLRGTLVGCANAEAVRLSPAERARCNERFGVDVAHAPVLDGIDPAKRARFDKAAARGEANRRYRDATGTQGAPSDPGGIAHGAASSEVFTHNAGDPK